MSIVCKNCRHHFSGNFCNNCGQEADTGRLGFHTLWTDVRHTYLRFNHKSYHTARALFTRPGHAIREYIEGRRILHANPLSFLLVLVPIYVLLFHYFKLQLLADVSSDNSLIAPLGADRVNEWLLSNYAWIVVLSIPLFAIGTSLTFLHRGYNYVEHVTVHIFLAVQKFIVQIALFPVLYFMYRAHHLHVFQNVNLLIQFLLMFWAFRQLFRQMSFVSVFIRLLGAYIIFIVLFSLIALAVFVALGATPFS